MNNQQIVMDEFAPFVSEKETQTIGISKEADTMKKIINWNVFGAAAERAPDKDVIVRINKHGGGASEGKGYYSLIFRFTNNAIKKVVTNSSNILPGTCGTRVYFKEAPAGCGKKVYRPSDTARPYIAIPIREDGKQQWEKYCGCYNLIDDADVGLYYIDLSKPIK